jgi:hypothetical protein
MVSDDIEIVTFKSQRGFRIRMTSVQAHYLLRELQSGDALTYGLEPHGTRVTLRLRDTVDLSERSLENIIRHWVVLPICRVEYVEEANPPVRIGYDSAAEFLDNQLRAQSKDPGLQPSRSDIITSKRSASPGSGSYDLAFLVQKGFFPERSFTTTDGRLQTVVCIEGIRVADHIPGFGGRGPLSAILSVRGTRSFRTTVSRSGLEQDEEYDKVGVVCADMLFEHIRSEVQRIAEQPGRPLSQASSAAKWLTAELRACAASRTSLEGNVPAIAELS